LASRALASQHSGWVTVGLNGLLYDWVSIIALAYCFVRLSGARRAIRPLLEIGCFVFPVFWFFCVITALTGSWMWATPAAVTWALMLLLMWDSAIRRPAVKPAEDAALA
jgi:hypothetical protein